MAATRCACVAVDVVALGEAFDRDRAAVALHGAAQEVVEHAQAQRAADGIDARHLEFGHRRGHDREPARQHRRALRLDAVQGQPRHVAGADHALAQPREAVGRDAARRQAVLFEDRGQRQRGAG